MTAAPRGQAKSAEENAPAPEQDIDLLGGSRDEDEALPAPEPESPNATTPEDSVDVSTEKGTTRQKRAAKAPKAGDPLVDLQLDAPIAVTLGDVVIGVAPKSGNTVVSFSLKGWVGEPEFVLLAKDVPGQLEPALAELRKAIKAAKAE